MAIALLIFGVSAASAKEFQPGDLGLCGATRCRSLSDTRALKSFTSLLYLGGPATRMSAPRVGSQVFELRLRDGFVAGVVTATAFRVHGLNCGRFRRGQWYRLPAALRGLTARLKPKRLRAHVAPSC